MSTVQVQVLDQGRLARAEKLLAGIPNGVQRAMKAAMVRAVSHLRANTVSTMQQAVQTTQSAVRQMDMYAQAAMSARSTMQGYIDGANGMAASVQAAYRSVAYGALAAIQGAMGAAVSAGIPRHARGTDNAAPGLALVGEEGPELVLFQGGEQVLNARETAALQARPALSALPASTGGGEPVVVQIYFQIEGGASPETVQHLRQYGEEFEARVRRVMDDYARDMARRRYS